MTHPRATYRERLTVSWWVWPAALGATALLTAQLTMGALPLRHPLTYAFTCGLAAIGLLALGRIRIEVLPVDGADRGELLVDGADGGELRVDDAQLPVHVIASVHVLDAAGRRDLLGVDADPLAFVIQRPWVNGGVRIDLDDPADPTPYWFVSSRHPQRLATAIMAAAPHTATRQAPH